jgi:Pentapeptide repeats (8 copies)
MDLRKICMNHDHLRQPLPIDLQDQSFRKMDLQGWDFSGRDIRGCDFREAQLAGANFRNVITGESKKQLFRKEKIFFKLPIYFIPLTYLPSILASIILIYRWLWPVDDVTRVWIPILIMFIFCHASVILVVAGGSFGIIGYLIANYNVNLATLFIVLCGIIAGFLNVDAMMIKPFLVISIISCGLSGIILSKNMRQWISRQKITGTNFQRACLDNVDFSGALLTNCHFQGASTKDVNWGRRFKSMKVQRE